MKSVLSFPSFSRSIRYSNGSKKAALTFITSGSPGNISGSSCLNISTQEGTSAVRSQPWSTSFGEHRNVDFLVPAHRLEIAEFEPRHAAAFLVSRQRNRNAVMREHSGEVLARARLVAVHVAGGEQRDLAGRAAGGLALGLVRQDLKPLAQRLRGVFRHPGVRVDARDAPAARAAPARCELSALTIGATTGLASGEPMRVGIGQRPVAQFRVALAL